MENPELFALSRSRTANKVIEPCIKRDFRRLVDESYILRLKHCNQRARSARTEAGLLRDEARRHNGRQRAEMVAHQRESISVEVAATPHDALGIRNRGGVDVKLS